MKKILVVAATVLLTLASGTAFADEWYITHEPVSSGDFLQEQDVGAKIYQQATQCLHVFGSKKIAELKKEFSGKLFITFFDPIRNATRITTTSKREGLEQVALSQHGSLEIVLYGRHAERHPRIQGAFQYVNDWGAVFVPALAITQPWFCEAFSHELSHVSADRKRIVEKKQRDVFLGPAWVDEEIRAHELGREVLNAFTGGRYLSALKVFVVHEKGLQVKNVQEILQKREIQSLVHLFHPASEKEMSLRRAQVLVDITFLLIEKDGGGIEEKRRAYIRIYQRNRR